ncbi:MAG TPA: phosphopantetheine-binding protein, partial [Thermoanaerobaculia bacterium]|nr:phosphopantetheine-binding protein [Thermoanaerobaculia bacterium]
QASEPRTESERQVLDLWEEILGRRLGVHDDFFDHGGHSLHATQFVARLKALTGRDLPVRALFERRTAAALGEWWERG